MKKIYQTINDPNKGNCMQAVIASLFDKELDEVPNFIELGQDWFKVMWDFINEQGYAYEGILYNKNYNRLMNPTHECFKDEKFYRPSMITPNQLKNYNGVNGYFYAAVLSPNHFNWSKQTTHAVIIDKDYNIVHDPSEGYRDLKKYPLTSLLKYNGIIYIYLFEKNG